MSENYISTIAKEKIFPIIRSKDKYETINRDGAQKHINTKW